MPPPTTSTSSGRASRPRCWARSLIAGSRGAPLIVAAGRGRPPRPRSASPGRSVSTPSTPSARARVTAEASLQLQVKSSRPEPWQGCGGARSEVAVVAVDGPDPRRARDDARHRRGRAGLVEHQAQARIETVDQAQDGGIEAQDAHALMRVARPDGCDRARRPGRGGEPPRPRGAGARAGGWPSARSARAARRAAARPRP